MSNPFSLDAFGGKPYPLWQQSSFNFPGYYNGSLQFKNIKTGKVVIKGFLVSPTQLSIQRNTLVQTNRTMGGWFVQRLGSAMTSVTFSGYMLDTRDINEIRDFIDKYSLYAEDIRTDRNELFSEWTQELYIDGWKYEGFIQTFNNSKTGVNPFVHQYSITFNSVKDSHLDDAIAGNDFITSQAEYIMNNYGTLEQPKKFKEGYTATRVPSRLETELGRSPFEKVKKQYLATRQKSKFQKAMESRGKIAKRKSKFDTSMEERKSGTLSQSTLDLLKNE